MPETCRHRGIPAQVHYLRPQIPVAQTLVAQDVLAVDHAVGPECTTV